METKNTTDTKKEPVKKQSVVKDEKPVEQQSIHRNASWGAVISIVIILAMIVVGAFYAWGKRVAEEHNLPETNTSEPTY